MGTAWPEELKQRLFGTTEELWQAYGGPMVLRYT